MPVKSRKLNIILSALNNNGFQFYSQLHDAINRTIPLADPSPGCCFRRHRYIELWRLFLNTWIFGRNKTSNRCRHRSTSQDRQETSFLLSRLSPTLPRQAGRTRTKPANTKIGRLRTSGPPKTSSTPDHICNRKRATNQSTAHKTNQSSPVNSIN